MSDLEARLRDDEALDMEHRARTKRMRHDDQWYGPMKGTQCRCSECLLAIDLLAVLAERDALLRRLGELEQEREWWGCRS